MNIIPEISISSDLNETKKEVELKEVFISHFLQAEVEDCSAHATMHLNNRNMRPILLLLMFIFTIKKKK